MNRPSLTAVRLRTEYRTDPLGLDEACPRLSWSLAPSPGFETARGLAQSAYQICVTSSRDAAERGEGDAWDSGRVVSEASTFVDYGGRSFGAGERAWWAVRVWDQDGAASPWSPAAFWEVGRPDRATWPARWIGGQVVGGPDVSPPALLLRRTFTLPAAVVSARLYATALGLYEFRLNGQKVGDDVFTPGWTDYRVRVQYQAYDVTALLRPGENAIGAVLGDGWYCGYTGNLRRRQYYGDRPKLLGWLRVSLADGTTLDVGTDTSWRVATGPVLASDFFMGEQYDARLELPDWDTPAFTTDARWTPAGGFDDPAGLAVVATVGPTVRATGERRPVAVTPLGDHGGTIVVDFGQNLVGRVRLRVHGPAGATVRMLFVETLDAQGRPYTANLRTARQTDVYTLRGDPAGETYESRFTFHGFRYAAVQGFPGTLTADALTAVVLHSDIAPTGTFECSDPAVNQLQQNIQWGQRGNFVDVPTDCPQRDERLGWTGDAQVFARTAAFNFDVSGFFAKWMADVRDAQSAAGEYPSVAPNNDDTSPVARDGGPAWADAGVICPWTMYLCYGDRGLLERHYASMRRFIESMRVAAGPFGMIRSHPDWPGWHGFGDWLSQDGRDGLFGNTPKDLIGTAFFAHDCRLMTTIATLLGHADDAAAFAALADTVAAAFRRRFVTPDGLLAGNTQTGYVLALHFDLLPEAQRPAAVAALVRDVRQNGNRLSTGFVGSPYLSHVLTRFGHLDVAYQLLMQRQWPSWLYAVDHGATTIWERWDGWTHDRGFQDAGMNSFNHYAYGAVGAWLYQTVAGIDIDPARPGYRHVLLRPRPTLGGPLTWAKATLDTAHGRIESGWRIDGRAVRWDVVLPPGVTATATVAAAGGITEGGQSLDRDNADAALHLSSGRYAFQYELA